MVAEDRAGHFFFPSMPNFRQINTEFVGDINSDVKHKVYRSSRPDLLTVSELERWKSLGIKTIIDFRSFSEYRKANGYKLLDELFPVYKVVFPSGFKYKPNQEIVVKKIAPRKYRKSVPSEDVEKEPQGKHFLLDFFRMNYIVAVFNRAPWYIRLYSMFILVIDMVLNTGYRYFVTLFARHVLNHNGLSGQYIDMLTYSQSSMCAALKILSDPENLPAMINCAHGKDRTGLVTALALSCLGTPKEKIAEDYARSQVELQPVRERVYDELVTRFGMKEEFADARREDILGALDFIETNYGSVPNYLESIGFSQSEQKKLRTTLTDSSGT